MKILILGANGFIGSHLSEALLEHTPYHVVGLDLADHNIQELLEHDRFQFYKKDMLSETDWIEAQIKACDVVLPLVAIALPATYVKDPLRIFNLDFEANLTIIRLCAKHKTRLLFPSTSEVYGMCSDAEFDEDKSSLVLGPINKQRWIYACSKQLLDRIIFAHGDKDELPFTLFRPFNWVGPKLDDIRNTTPGKSRVMTQFIGNILRGEPIKLVDGGMQKRCFTYIDDGIEALIRIIENDEANAEIINIGAPQNNYSIKSLAEILVKRVKANPQFRHLADSAEIIDTSSDEYYGDGYQDVSSRVPSIAKAEQLLGWIPQTDMVTLTDKTLQYYFETYAREVA